MAYDLGDPIPLTWTVLNAAGVPQDATLVVLTITLPDGSTAAPAITAAGSGVYAPTTPYVATQEGHYLIRWVATGTNASTKADVANVLAADPRFIISLAEARTVLGLAAANTTKDEDLRGYIAAVTPIVEDIAGPVLAATKTWTDSGGRTSIVLPYKPAAITSVVEDGVTLTAGTDYVTNLKAGVITRGSSSSPRPFAAGQQNVVVTYTVGAAVVTEAVIRATRIILKQMWQADIQGYRPSFGAPDSDTVLTPSGFLVPKRALELLQPTPNMPGFA